ncbi:MAG TPA: MFS transporter [Alphaproteobacteria bacterium]
MMAQDSSAGGTGLAATRWGVVMIVVGAGVVAAFQVGKAPAAIPALRAELGLSLFAAGCVISLFNAMAVVGGMAAGAIADRLGHRRATLAGLALIAVANLLGGFASGGSAILASRFVEGLGFLAIIVSVPSLIIQAAAPRDLKFVLGLWGCYMPLGAALIILAFPIVLGPFGWRGLWWANALVAALYAVALASTTRAAAPEPLEPIGEVLRLWDDMKRTATSAGPAALALCFLFYSANWLAVVGFLPTFLVEQRGLAGGAAAALTALVVVVNAGGNLSGGWLLRRGVKRWRLLAFAHLAMAAASIAIFSTALPDEARYFACLLFSCLSGVLPASVFSGVPHHAPSPDLIATTNGLVVQGANLGQMAGPPLLAALVGSSGGWAISPLFVVGASTLGLGCALWVNVLERRRNI